MKKIALLLALLGAVFVGLLWRKHAEDPASPTLGEFVEELPMAHIKVLRPWTWLVGLRTAYRAARCMNNWHLYKQP